LPLNNYSLGIDVTIDIVGSFGAIVRFKNVTHFDSKQETQQIKIVGINGLVDFLEIPHGWMGSMEIDRQNAVLDQYIALFEANYYAGANILTASITQTIREPDLSTSQYRFTGAMFKLSDAGAWKGDAQVKQKLDWCAAKRLRMQ
jgi:hypothetical protein